MLQQRDNEKKSCGFNKGNITLFSVATGIAVNVVFGKNPDLLLGSVAKNLSLIIGVTVGLVLLISGAYKLAKHCEAQGLF